MLLIARPRTSTQSAESQLILMRSFSVPSAALLLIAGLCLVTGVMAAPAADAKAAAAVGKYDYLANPNWNDKPKPVPGRADGKPYPKLTKSISGSIIPGPP